MQYYDIVLGAGLAFFNAHGDNFVIYISHDGHVRSLSWNGNDRPLHENLFGVANKPLASQYRPPDGYYIAQNDTQQIVYRARDDGHLYELFWKGVEAVRGWDLTAAAERPRRHTMKHPYHTTMPPQTPSTLSIGTTTAGCTKSLGFLEA
jgi:hypothetical protein